MEQATIKLMHGHYIYKGSNSRELEILAVLLTDDVEAGEYSFARGLGGWVKDKEFDTLETNVAIIKKQDDQIVLSDKFDEMEDVPGIFEGGEFRLHKDKFIALLKSWDDITKTGAEEILILRTQDGVTFEAR